MKIYSICLLMLVYSGIAFGHGDEVHQEKAGEGKVHKLELEIGSANKDINMSYLKEIKPIFQKKCLDCHGEGNKKPWYYAIPGPKQLMDRDIEEAKEHMDMSNDFPFGGHGTPEEDLESLVEMLKNDSMPPWQYKLIHWSSSLTDDEETTIKKWIKESLNLINQQQTKGE